VHVLLFHRRTRSPLHLGGRDGNSRSCSHSPPLHPQRRIPVSRRNVWPDSTTPMWHGYKHDITNHHHTEETNSHNSPRADETLNENSDIPSITLLLFVAGYHSSYVRQLSSYHHAAMTSKTVQLMVHQTAMHYHCRTTSPNAKCKLTTWHFLSSQNRAVCQDGLLKP